MFRKLSKYYSMIQHSNPYALLALCTLWFLFWTWTHPLLIPDEGRYVGVAWEMVRSGNYLTPTLNGLPYFHKPPLMYWITSLGINLFGANEFAARLASICGVMLGIGSTYLFLRRWTSVAIASMFLVIAMCQPLLFAGSQYANLDMLVAGFISATIICLAHTVLLIQNQLPYQKYLLLSFMLAGWGFLAKGLIGFVLPAGVIFFWLISIGQWRLLKPLLVQKWGWILFAIIVLPWCITMQIKHAEFFNYFFIHQHFQRFSQTGFNNMQAWWFYIPVLLVSGLPFVYWIAKTLPKLTYSTHRDIRRLAWIWLCLITLFFSIPASKLIGYIFPTIFPLALLAADAYYATAENRWKNRFWQYGNIAFLGLIAVAIIFVAFFSPKNQRPLGHFLLDNNIQPEQVFMGDAYFFAVPFYAQFTRPVNIISTWNDPTIYQVDNWRKEIADAAKEFHPEAFHQTLLLKNEVNLCSPTDSYFLISQPAHHRGIESQIISMIKDVAKPVYSFQTVDIWKLDATQARQHFSCPDIPTPATADLSNHPLQTAPQMTLPSTEEAKL